MKTMSGGGVWRAVGLAVAMLTALGAQAQGADPLARGERLAREHCAVCHGACGQSVAPNFPRLAGQNAGYLMTQLDAFARGERKDPTMAEKVKGLSAEDREAVAMYYASQKPGHTPSGDTLLLAVGQFIYERGNRHSGLPPCATCHGKQAAGSTELPRLAGQHPQYLIRQMQSFRQGAAQRDSAIMRVMAHRLSDLELEAVAAYLGNLQ
ncbi:cytochrome c4 [Tepidimonas taiwanensis]|uniref:Cytochrome c4 n=1 Tax=Tepidimonas taiwanensis TaxID=307486 RepID=A0A554X991_9BURK|nr:c-type cytochrome [Tepidimonas taiwanensis]TSE32400.1 Cytochrome c4 [Tepidimonas taiwanensis]UBQ06577.1 cytochrome c4 [Tepidimonas taiwanensis]